MGFSNGTLKWMVKIMENPIKMDDLGVPLFLESSSKLGILKKAPTCQWTFGMLG